MSMIQPPRFSSQHNSPFVAGQYNTNRSNYGEFITSFQPRVGRKMRSTSPSTFLSPETYSESRKRRSYSDESSSYGLGTPESPLSKRARTAPSSPLSRIPQHLSPIASKYHDSPSKVTLPSISEALASFEVDRILPKPSAPTVSLDYFDTYKPNDANWRHGLWNSIRNSSSAFSLEKYAYLHNHVSNSKASWNSGFESTGRPCFDSRVSSKALPTVSHRKINFPYESNYTYLNKTYLKDVEKFPEYLQLAQSLVQLSKSTEPMKKSERRGEKRSKKSDPKSKNIPQEFGISSILNMQKDAQSSHETSHQTPSMDSHFVPLTNTTNQYSNSRLNQSPTTTKLPDLAYLTAHFTTKTPEVDHAPSPVSPPFSNNKAPKEQKNIQATRFIPITPPSVKNKTRSELMRSPKSVSTAPRVCISCGSDQSPCWRPSWSIQEGQLCNSCGLRYKKTAARCLNSSCKKVPAKGEWALMQSKGKTTFEDGEQAHQCLGCGWKVEVNR